MKWMAIVYIIAVLVLSAKANAFSSDSNPALLFKDHQAKQSETLNVQDPLPEVKSQVDRLVNVDS